MDTVIVFEVVAPRNARDKFEVIPIDGQQEVPVDVKQLKALWPSGLSQPQKPSRIITLGKVHSDNSQYACMLLFVPTEEFDEGGRQGLYKCNGVIANTSKDVTEFLLSLSAEQCAYWFPALRSIVSDKLKSFQHIFGLRNEKTQATCNKIIKGLNQAPDPILVESSPNVSAVLETEAIAFLLWQSKVPYISTSETRLRKPWIVSFNTCVKQLTSTKRPAGCLAGQQLEKISRRLNKLGLDIGR